MRLARDFEKQWGRVLSGLSHRLEVLEDEAFSPQASSGEFLLWCVTHDRRLDACEAIASREDFAGFVVECDAGPMLDEGSPVSDPTGSTALAFGNPKRSDLKLVGRQLEALGRIVGHIDLLTAIPEPRDGATIAMDSRKVAVANQSQAGCDPCARAGTWTPPHTLKGTTVDGRLPAPVLLCGWHYKWVRAYGELPNEREEADHQAGKRVTRVIRQTDRLRRGLMEGKLT